MDAARFDALIRFVFSRPSRRGMLAALGRGVLVGSPLAFDDDRARRRMWQKLPARLGVP